VPQSVMKIEPSMTRAGRAPALIRPPTFVLLPLGSARWPSRAGELTRSHARA